MEEEFQSPTEQLAEEIAVALIDAGLIEEARKKELLNAMVAGKVKSEDWALWVDTALEAASKESSDGE